jgi:hypothetical protein
MENIMKHTVFITSPVGVIFYVCITHINTCSHPRSYKGVNTTYYEAPCVVLSFLAILTRLKYSTQRPQHLKFT